MAVSAAQRQKEGYQLAVLPELPYAKDALAPYLSAETLKYHYGKHHQTYVDTLNDLIDGTPYEKQTLEDMIREADGKVFNNAAQVWNHTFYWHGFSPKGGGQPGDELMSALSDTFGDFATFKDAFETKCKNVFGSGWVWLVRDEDGQLKIEIGKDAGNPLRENNTPLLNCDMWEHAFYIDYRNDKQKYLDAFWNIVNWDTVARRLAGDSKV